MLLSSMRILMSCFLRLNLMRSYQCWMRQLRMFHLEDGRLSLMMNLILCLRSPY